MGTVTRKRQGKKAAKLNDLPTKAKRAGETKGGASNRLIVVSKYIGETEKNLKNL